MTETFPIDSDLLLRRTEWVRHLAVRLVSDRDAADDVAQQAWLVALERPDLASQPGRLAAVVRHLAWRRLRKESARRAKEARARTAAPIAESSRLAEELELHRRVVAAVSALDDPYRTVVLLRYFEGLEPRRIARRRGVSASTVRSQITRGLRQLRRRLETELGGGERDWRAVLLPLALPGWPAASSIDKLTFLGGGLMTMKKVVVGAAVAVLLIGVLVVVSSELGGDESGLDRAPARRAETADATIGARRRAGPEVVTPTTVASGDEEREPAAAPAPRSVLAGRVVDGAERPLADATVRVLEARRLEATDQDPFAIIRSLFRRERAVAETRSGTGGAFSFENLPSADYRLEVRHPGYVPLYTKLVSLLEGLTAPPQTIKLSRGRPVAGRVVDDLGAPVSGATIAIHSNLTDATLDIRTFKVESDAAGHFEFAAVEAGDNVVFAKADGFATATAKVRAGTTDLELGLSRGVTVEGRVLDEAGTPVARVRIAAISGQLSVSEGTSDVEGRYRLAGIEPRRGRIIIIARKRGYSVVPQKRGEPSSRLRAVEITRELHAGMVLEQDLTLARGVTVRGRVVDGDSGEGIAGARVRALTNEYARAEEAATTTSGPDGRYELDAVPPGQVLVVAYRDGYVMRLDPAAARFARKRDRGGVLVDEPRGGLDVELEPVVTVHGRVVTGDGAPITRARITWSDGGAEDGDPMVLGRQSRRHAVSDDRGRFRLTDVVRSETVRVRARHPDFAAGSVVVSTRGGGETEVELRLMPCAALRLTLLTPDGEPAPGLEVELRLGGHDDAGRDPVLDVEPPPTLQLAVTGPGGHVELAGLEPGTAWLRLVGAGDLLLPAADSRIELEPGETIERRVLLTREVLEGGDVITGRVVDGKGRPVEKARVEATPRFGLRKTVALASSTTDAEGRFLFRLQRPGLYRLDARGVGCTAGEISAGRASVPSVATGTSDVEIELRPRKGR